MKQALTHPILFFTSTLILFIFLSGCEKRESPSLQTETLRVDSLAQVTLLKNALVKPVIYTNISGLEQLPIVEAKAKFISAVLPSILIAKYHIEEGRKKITMLSKKERWSVTDSSFYLNLKTRYKAKGMDDLIFRMRTLPNSIVLAQAAVESGWGQSRFFLKANNLFGIWSFNKNEPRIAAVRIRGNKRIYLRSYQDMPQSIINYFEILSRSKAYWSLRKARLQTSDPLQLLPHLKNFSERRTLYTNQLKNVILLNKLKHYDHYQIDPKYIMVD